MAINSLGKNSIGVILALMLVILLSESRLFKLLTDTYLGRAFLIIILLFASYLHKILGVVCVFIIIIMFNNNNNSSYYEGFDGNTSDSNTVGDKVEKAKNAVSKAANAQNSTTATSTTPEPTTTNAPNNKIDVITSALKNDNTSSDTTNSATITSTSASTTPSIEGFDLQSTENNIKRGKQSNSIPVQPFLMQSPQVAPYESANFSENFGVL
jgi:FtsZ-interacting cell division protein ZipA